MQLGHDVAEGGQTDPQRVGGLLFAVGAHLGGKSGQLLRRYVRQIVSCQRQKPLCGLVGFRMDGSVVQYVFALWHAKKAGALFKGLWPQLRNLLNLRTGCKGSVFLAVGHNVLCGRRRQTGNSLEQGRGGSIQIDAHSVHAVLHDRVQRGVQLLRRHIMLILTDADGLRLDLDQLRQRVLQSAGNGDGRAQVHVELRELLCRQL